MKGNKLASHLANNEAGLVQARIGDKRQDVVTLGKLLHRESKKNMKLYGRTAYLRLVPPTVRELIVIGERHAAAASRARKRATARSVKRIKKSVKKAKAKN